MAARERRLTDLYVRQLEYLFSPPGMPLVHKGGPAGAPTTTILVRGEAGAGKTTLGLALAHSIARAGKGALLVLSTETSPVEYEFKARLLGLHRPRVLPWGAREKSRRGALLVQHVALARGPGDEAAEDEPPIVVDIAWEMLQAYASEEHETPITAVLIDGILLTDEGSLPPRSETAAFLQALEARGVSVVLVEESSPQQSSWLPFVVDLVFELRFELDPELHKLVRHLVCYKSRYSTAAAGPHEYDQDDDDILSVWPDPLDLHPDDLDVLLPGNNPEPVIFWPLTEQDKCWVWRGGGLLCAAIDNQWDIVQAISNTWSVRPAFAHIDDLPDTSEPDATAIGPIRHGGAYAFAWALARAAREGPVNAVVIHQLGALFGRSRSSEAVIRTLRALMRAGFLVGIRDHEELIARIDPFSQFSAASHRMSATRTMPRRILRGFERWEAAPPSLAQLRGDELMEVRRLAPHWSDIERTLKTSPEDIDAKALKAVQECSQQLRSYFAKADEGLAGPYLAFLACADLLQRLGSSPFTQPRRIGKSSADPRISENLGWLWYLVGNDWSAAQAALPSGLSGASLLLWNGFCARYADSPEARDALKVLSASEGSSSVLCGTLAARAFMANNQPNEARDVVERCVADLSPWTRRRWHAELAAEFATSDALPSVVEQLTELTGDDSVPPLQRADVFLNLALLADQRQDKAASAAARQRAMELNPLLLV